MTHREINKKIAEIKGMPIIQINQEWFFDRAKIDNPYLDGYWGLTNWAESIADAWELFEEMPRGTTIFKNLFGENKFCCWVGNSGPEGIVQKADIAPLAICKAWLKFKGVEI